LVSICKCGSNITLLGNNNVSVLGDFETSQGRIKSMRVDR